MTPLVRFDRVQKIYDGRTSVVQDLTLDIQPGEFFSIVGPSGSGKTTILMMLAGLERPTAGEIHLNGGPVTSLPAHRRDIGVVFQHYALFPHLTVRRNVAFPLEVRGCPAEETARRVEKALELVKMKGFEERRPGQLSGGQQQRVALARAVVFDPALVLLDEPLGALDRQLRDQMQVELKQIHARLGATMVYVTHDQSEALTLSDRIAVFHAGRVQQVGTPRNVYDSPANAFVARFVGESNSLMGTVVEARDTWRRVQLADGWVVEAVSADAPGPNGMAMVSVRPEHLLLGAAADPCANRVLARVEEIVYQGDATRVRLRTPRGHELLAKVPPRFADRHVRRGDRIAVAWRLEDCRGYAWGPNVVPPEGTKGPTEPA